MVEDSSQTLRSRVGLPQKVTPRPAGLSTHPSTLRASGGEVHSALPRATELWEMGPRGLWGPRRRLEEGDRQPEEPSGSREEPEKALALLPPPLSQSLGEGGWGDSGGSRSEPQALPTHWGEDTWMSQSLLGSK